MEMGSFLDLMAGLIEEKLCGLALFLHILLSLVLLAFEIHVQYVSYNCKGNAIIIIITVMKGRVEDKF